MSKPREGSIWRNKRSGRTCEIKMITTHVHYRYRVPDKTGGRTYPLKMPILQFLGSFFLIEGGSK